MGNSEIIMNNIINAQKRFRTSTTRHECPHCTFEGEYKTTSPVIECRDCGTEFNREDSMIEEIEDPTASAFAFLNKNISSGGMFRNFLEENETP